MTLKHFLISVWPVWVSEIIMIFVDYIVTGIDALTTWGYMSLLISITLLPFIAGWRIRTYSKSIIWAVIAATSFSVISYSSIYVFLSSLNFENEPIISVVFNWLFFAVVIQALFGIIGSISNSINTKRHNKSLNQIGAKDAPPG